MMHYTTSIFKYLIVKTVALSSASGVMERAPIVSWTIATEQGRLGIISVKDAIFIVVTGITLTFIKKLIMNNTFY